MFGSAHHLMLQRVKGNLFGYACALTRDSDDAADLFQDSVVRAMSSGSVPGDERAFRTWLFKILRNLWIDRIRSRQRQRKVNSDLETSPESTAGGADDAVVNHLAVRQAFQRLSKSHRDVLALVDIGGFSYEEAAKILDVPRGTVMSRVSRARQALSESLAGSGVTPMSNSRRGRPDA